jgi:hypothetical protein
MFEPRVYARNSGNVKGKMSKISYRLKRSPPLIKLKGRNRRLENPKKSGTFDDAHYS